MKLNEEVEITVEEFKNILENENGIFEIETPNGWVLVNVFYDRGFRDSCKIVSEKGLELTCSKDHLLFSEDDWIETEKLNIGSIVRTKNFIDKVESIEEVGKQHVYDIWINSPEHAYYSNDFISHNCGKTEFVREIASRCGFEKVFQVNGREDMGTGDFLGEQSVEVDKTTSQSKIVFRKGPLYLSFIQGTQLDENGNQVLDKDGNPIVTGKPGLFFLDEFAALMPSVFLSVFNRVMEIPPNPGLSRSLEISIEGGKIVKSHPGFAMILSGNTLGKGTESDSMMGYTAQNNIMDDSTLNRITAIYDFKYNEEAERAIVIDSFQDEALSDSFLEFVRLNRNMFEEGKVSTLISTRTIVNLMEVYTRLIEIYEEEKALQTAFKRSIINGLRESEVSGWKESFRRFFNIEL